MKLSSKINVTWHKGNKMPNNPTLEQRIKWHKEHLENCQCRKPNKKLLELIRKGGD